jgi:hypothetical protein
MFVPITSRISLRIWLQQARNPNGVAHTSNLPTVIIFPRPLRIQLSRFTSHFVDGSIVIIEDVHESIARPLCEVARMLGSRRIFEYSRRSGEYGEDNGIIAAERE